MEVEVGGTGVLVRVTVAVLVRVKVIVEVLVRASGVFVRVKVAVGVLVTVGVAVLVEVAVLAPPPQLPGTGVMFKVFNHWETGAPCQEFGAKFPPAPLVVK